MRRSLSTVLLAGLASVGAMSATAHASSPTESVVAYVLSDVQCDSAGDGVVDLVLVNDAETGDARFVVDGVETDVAPLSAHAVTFTQLSDGDVDIPVQIEGVESRVRLAVHCDLPIVEVAPPPVPLRPGGTGGVLALSGVSAQSEAGIPMLPATGVDTTLWALAALMVLSGAALTVAARRRTGSPRG